MATLTLQPERERARRRYARAIASMTWPMMLTLTRARRDTPLTIAALRDTMRAFARLRRTKAFRSVRGGIASLEISGTAEHWHDHVHAIIDAQWLEITPTVAAWRRAVRDSGTIHLQRLKSPKRALIYITKPQPLAFQHTLKAGRLVTAWGSCHQSHQSRQSQSRPNRESAV